MRKLSNEKGEIKLVEVTVDHADDLIRTGRRALLTSLGLLAIAGCSSNSGRTGYHYGGSRYYGRNTYRRSPASRGRGR